MGFGAEIRIVMLWALLLVLLGCLGQAPVGQQQGAQPSGQSSGQNTAPNATAPATAIIYATSGIEKGLEEVPDPLSGDNPLHPLVQRAVPAAGEKFSDPGFGTPLARVTGTLGIRHEYSRFDPFNRGKTMVTLIVPATGEWKVFRTSSLPYDSDANLVATITDFVDPRWDPMKPDIMWGLKDFSIVNLNVTSGEETTIRDFRTEEKIAPILRSETDLYQITMNNEGESSIDKRYWALILQGTNEDYRPRYIFTWDRQTDTVLGLYKVSQSESSIDWVGMSPLGNYVLIGGDETDSGNINGLMMADLQLKTFHRLDYATAHSDTGLDASGNEVLVMQGIRTDYVDMIPLNWSTTPLPDSGEYAGTGRVPLVRLYYDSESSMGFNSGIHVSCNAPGYCVVSANTAPNVPEQNWLDRSIILVKLNQSKPGAYYIAKQYGTTADYWEETQATISNDGTRVLWATNWNQGVGAENAGSVFEMQADLGG